MTRLLPAAAIVFALCAPGYAVELDVKFGEGVKLPSSLKWQRAGITSKHKDGFNTGNIDAKKQEYLYNLWAKEIAEKTKGAMLCAKTTPDVLFPRTCFWLNFLSMA